LLNLGRIDFGERPAFLANVDPDLVLREILANQEDDFLDQSDKIGRGAAISTWSGQAKHSARDSCRSFGPFENLLKRPATEVRVGIAEPELGVIEDRREGVIEFVADTSGQNAKATDTLKLDHLTAQGFDVFPRWGWSPRVVLG
jgi:hypothetical protein